MALKLVLVRRLYLFFTTHFVDGELNLSAIEMMLNFEKIMSLCRPRVIHISDNYPRTMTIPLEYMGGVFHPDKLLSVQELVFQVTMIFLSYSACQSVRKR